MKVLCIFGRHNYGNPDRGQGYEYTNFVPALHNLGHEVVFFESLNKLAYTDFADLNRTLLDMVQKEQPDVIFCVLMGYEIWLETFELLRQGCNAALIQWATDDSWKYEQFSKFIAPVFDIYATTYASAMMKAEADGHDNFVLTQWAASSENMNKPLPVPECQYDVSFIGSTYGNRKQWIEELEERGVDVTCFGYGWPNGSVAAEEIPRIIQKSVISLNFGDSGLVIQNGKPVRSRQIKARVFEVPGAGGLLMTEAAEYLDNFYRPDEEIIIFEDIDDLVEKIEHIITHPGKRDAIANAGFSRTQRDHSYEARFKPLLEQAMNRRKMRPKTTNGIDFGKFEALVASHRPHLLQKLLKVVILLPCILLWGKQRGPRAARRILFEFSWRIYGRTTYTASGWPGRLFYKQS